MIEREYSSTLMFFFRISRRVSYDLSKSTSPFRYRMSNMKTHTVAFCVSHHHSNLT